MIHIDVDSQDSIDLENRIVELVKSEEFMLICIQTAMLNVIFRPFVDVPIKKEDAFDFFSKVWDKCEKDKQRIPRTQYPNGPR